MMYIEYQVVACTNPVPFIPQWFPKIVPLGEGVRGVISLDELHVWNSVHVICHIWVIQKLWIDQNVWSQTPSQTPTLLAHWG